MEHRAPITMHAPSRPDDRGSLKPRGEVSLASWPGALASPSPALPSRPGSWQLWRLCFPSRSIFTQTCRFPTIGPCSFSSRTLLCFHKGGFPVPTPASFLAVGQQPPLLADRATLCLPLRKRASRDRRNFSQRTHVGRVSKCHRLQAPCEGKDVTSIVIAAPNTPLVEPEVPLEWWRFPFPCSKVRSPSHGEVRRLKWTFPGWSSPWDLDPWGYTGN